MKRRFIRFLLVGALNTLVGYLLYAFFIFCNLHYAQAVLLATIIGALFNFKSIGRLVFKSHDNRLIFRFLAVYAITYLLNVAGLRLFAGHQVNLYLAGIVLALPVALVSYLLHSTFVFRAAATPCTDDEIPR
jgi:putative flippase GtrA